MTKGLFMIPLMLVMFILSACQKDNLVGPTTESQSMRLIGYWEHPSITTGDVSVNFYKLPGYVCITTNNWVKTAPYRCYSITADKMYLEVDGWNRIVITIKNDRTWYLDFSQNIPIYRDNLSGDYYKKW